MLTVRPSGLAGQPECSEDGGGTGMLTFDFKAGNGSSSRIAEIAGQRYTLGVFVQSNFGRREDFTLAGRAIGPPHRAGQTARQGPGFGDRHRRMTGCSP